MSIKGTANKVKFKAEQNAPEILLALGIIGFAGTAILAAKKAPKAKESFDAKYKELLEQEETFKKAGETEEGKKLLEDAYAEAMADSRFFKARKWSYDRDAKKTLLGLKLGFVKDAIKPYAPVIVLGLTSTGLLIMSHNILAARNAALSVAAAGIKKAYDTYRSRVREELGEEVDNAFLHGTKLEKIKKTITNDDGKEEEVEELVEVKDNANTANASPFRVFFDSSSNLWTADAAYNMQILKSREALLNLQLQRDGYVLYNEAMLFLGFEKGSLPAWGWEFGWKYYKNGENPWGDNYIDLGLYKIYEATDDAIEKAREINGYETVITLEPNVDYYPIMSKRPVINQ